MYMYLIYCFQYILVCPQDPNGKEVLTLYNRFIAP